MWKAIDWCLGAERRGSAPASSSRGRTLAVLPDGTRVEFDQGAFDPWCVYLAPPGQTRRAPRDTDYFTTLRNLHARFPQLHRDFVEVFERTSKGFNPAVLDLIADRAATYPPEVRTEIQLLLVILHAAMMAEENREHAPLGKRIKRLGVHQILVEGWPVEQAAHFSRGRPWRELDALCRERGF